MNVPVFAHRRGHSRQEFQVRKWLEEAIALVLTVNSIRLAQSRESRDASAHGRHSQTDLVGGNRALPITSFAHMGRFGSRDEIHTRMNNTPAAVSVSKV